MHYTIPIYIKNPEASSGCYNTRWNQPISSGHLSLALTTAARDKNKHSFSVFRQRRLLQENQLLCWIFSTLTMNSLKHTLEKRYYSTTCIRNCLKARTLYLEGVSVTNSEFSLHFCWLTRNFWQGHTNWTLTSLSLTFPMPFSWESSASCLTELCCTWSTSATQLASDQV